MRKKQKRKNVYEQGDNGRKKTGREARKLDRESRHTILSVSRFDVRNKISHFLRYELLDDLEIEF